MRSGAVLRIVSCASRHETQDSTNDAQILFYATTDKINPRLAAGLLRHASKRTKFTGFVGMTKPLPLSAGASLVPARTAIVR